MISKELVVLLQIQVKTMDRIKYESPETEVLEMKVERSICESEHETEVVSYRTDYENRGELTWD